MAMMAITMLLGGGRMAEALPDGFRKEVLTNARSGFPTEILFSPDGRTMYFSRKNGRIHLLTASSRGGTFGNLQMALDLTLETCTEGERGLGDIALHPDFSETDNRWMYVYLTVPNNQGLCSEDVFSGAQNVLVRYAVQDDMTLDASSRELLLESPPLPLRTHNGGSIQFGVDGFMYVTIGDGDMRGDAPLVNNLLGGIVRLTPEGDIPDTNPFVGDPQAVRCHIGGRAGNDNEKCVELYAVGLRNPFKMSMDPNSVDAVRFMVRIYIYIILLCHASKRGGDKFGYGFLTRLYTLLCPLLCYFATTSTGQRCGCEDVGGNVHWRGGGSEGTPGTARFWMATLRRGLSRRDGSLAMWTTGLDGPTLSFLST